MDRQTRAQIVAILDQTPDMTLATVRPDGFPQATVVSFVHDGLTIYFGTFRGSQKARNIARDDRVSLTVTRPYEGWNDIEGISMGGRARAVDDPEDVARVSALLMKRFPQAAEYEPQDTTQLALIRIDPVVVSLLDYARGFGHTESYDLLERLAAGG